MHLHEWKLLLRIAVALIEYLLERFGVKEDDAL